MWFRNHPTLAREKPRTRMGHPVHWRVKTILVSRWSVLIVPGGALKAREGRVRAMVIRTRSEIPSSEITPRETYMNRRAFMTGAAAMGVAAAVAGGGIAGMTRPSDVEAAEKLNLVGSP